MKELLEETAECREKEILEERVRLIEKVLKYIYDPGEGALYMSVENSTGYDGIGNEYELSQCVISDTHYLKALMILNNIGILMVAWMILCVWILWT